MRVEVPRFKRYYDVMLYINGDRISRTVDFLLNDGRPTWSGEQEFITVDDTLILLTGHKLKCLSAGARLSPQVTAGVMQSSHIVA